MKKGDSMTYLQSMKLNVKLTCTRENKKIKAKFKEKNEKVGSIRD